MSDQPTRRAPPGWYSEQGQHGYRYWDGKSWIESPAKGLGSSIVSGGHRSSPLRQRPGLAFMGAATALLIAGLLLPWAEAGSEKKGALDGGLPWLVGPGDVADTWLLVVATAAVLWASAIAAIAGDSQRMWATALVAGLAIMGFCVAQGLSLDDDLDLSGAEVGIGLFLAYAGGACSAVGGVLLRPDR